MRIGERGNYGKRAATDRGEAGRSGGGGGASIKSIK